MEPWLALIDAAANLINLAAAVITLTAVLTDRAQRRDGDRTDPTDR